MDEEQIDCNARQQKVKDDQPVPDNRKREKQIEDVRGIEYAGLQCGEERYARILVGIPEWKDSVLEEVYPQDLRRDKKWGQVSLDKNQAAGQDSVKIKEHENEQNKKIERPHKRSSLK
ncbi:MAG TPA: hypothetical protein VKF36_18420 [Syntrophorhabdales bacterium]|nr:hypothetical protein [Syntrophorhabdales bacterium]